MFYYSIFRSLLRENMSEKNQNELAIQRFTEYIQIKTVQPEPDYDGAMKFLKSYAQELGLEYRAITLDESRQAAVLTVKWFGIFSRVEIYMNLF